MTNTNKPTDSGKNGSRTVTLNDVATALGISKATVSLAINGDERVALKTREKILQKIEELGYVYNRSAAGLTKGETRTIGLAVHDITNPYFTEVCAAIEAVLSQNGRMSFLCNTNESVERQTNFTSALAEYRADGLILCPASGTDAKSLQPLAKRGLPTVLITREVEGAEFDFVGNDGMLALKLATKHLIRLGHSRIAMLGGGQDTSASRNRRAGFYAAMEEQGLAVDPELVVACDTTPQSGEKALKQILSTENPPTAAVCFTDLVALGAMSQLHRSGLVPGKDFALVGCDDIEEAGRGYAQLTTVKIKKGTIGRTAAEILMQRIADPNLPVQRVVLKPELVIRKSCGTP